MKRPLFLLFCCLTWLSCHHRPARPGGAGRKPSSGEQRGTGKDANDSSSNAGDIGASNDHGSSKDNISDGSGAGTTPDPKVDSSGNAAQGIVSVDENNSPLDKSLLNLKSFPKVSVERLLSQVWKFDDADQPHWNEIFWDSVQDKRQFPELALYPDHRFTENARARLRMGKWKLNKETRELMLLSENGPSRSYMIGDLAIKRIELFSQERIGVADIRLSATAIVHQIPREDPFYPANNEWRLKPRKSESDDLIRRRVKGYVHFFALFFWDNYLRSDPEISYSGLPCCFNWYNGGIGMQEKSDVDRRWIDCFYSQDQALKAYDMLGQILQNHVLKWPDHPNSWVKQLAQVLDQMETKL